MNRPNLRTAAVAAGFVAVSLVVAGTAAGMVGTPADAPVASAVLLAQEDPESLTPAIEAPDSATDPAELAAAPVEVGSPAIQCNVDGVCERPSRSGGDDGNRDSGHRSAAAPAGAEPPQPGGDCDRPPRPGQPSWGADAAEWERALEKWAEQWQAMAERCGWHPRDWPTAPHVDHRDKPHDRGGDAGHYVDKGWRDDWGGSRHGSHPQPGTEDSERAPWHPGEEAADGEMTDKRQP